MKIRKGFITNSSSSSFILGFNSKESVAEELLNDPAAEGHVEEIYKKCMSSGVAIESILESVEWEEESLLDDYMGYGLSWDEFLQVRDTDKYAEELNKQMEKFKADAKGKTYFVDISYEGKMEYDVAPHLKCLLRSYSHH